MSKIQSLLPEHTELPDQPDYSLDDMPGVDFQECVDLLDNLSAYGRGMSQLEPASAEAVQPALSTLKHHLEACDQPFTDILVNMPRQQS